MFYSSFLLFELPSAATLFLGYIYLGTVSVAHFYQRKLQYFPDRLEYKNAAGSSLFVHFITKANDGVELKGMYLAPTPNQQFNSLTVLHLHGNAGNIYQRITWARIIHQRFGCGIVLLDYRGFGGSSGNICEKGLIRDANAGVDWILKHLPGKCKIILHLESIGSAVGLNISANVCNRSKVKGCVVEGGLCSCLELAQDLFPFLPVKYMLKDKWENSCIAARQLSENNVFLSLHGAMDDIVPFKHGRNLYEAARSTNKTFRCFPRGVHNDLIIQRGYFVALEIFYSELLTV
jgi:fermentation-respiration switch protein FrsA (DUF1100 family)